MVVLQLFVALVVLLTSDGAQSQGNTQCASMKENFCHHVRNAYDENEKARKQLKHKCYEKDKIHLLGINTLLTIILTRTDKDELLAVTVSALEMETKELKQLKESCKNRGWKFDCFLAISKVVHATVELVEAIKELAKGTKPDVVKIVESAQTEYQEGRNQSTIEGGIKLGESIANSINESGSITFKWLPETTLGDLGTTGFY